MSLSQSQTHIRTHPASSSPWTTSCVDPGMCKTPFVGCVPVGLGQDGVILCCPVPLKLWKDPEPPEMETRQGDGPRHHSPGDPEPVVINRAYVINRA